MASSGGGGGSTSASLKRARPVSLAAPGSVGVRRHPPPLLRRSGDQKPARVGSSLKSGGTLLSGRGVRRDGSVSARRDDEERDGEGQNGNGGRGGGGEESSSERPIGSPSSPANGAPLPGGIVPKKKTRRSSAPRLGKKLRVTPSHSAASSSAAPSQSSGAASSSSTAPTSLSSSTPSPSASHPTSPTPFSPSSSSPSSSSSSSLSVKPPPPTPSSLPLSSFLPCAPASTLSSAPTSNAPSSTGTASSASPPPPTFNPPPPTFNPLFVPEIRRSATLPRWRLHNALDEMSPTSVQFLESAWQNGDVTVTIFDATGNVYQAKFIRDPASRYQAVSRRVDHKGTEFGEGRPMNRRSDAEIEGPIEFETVCSGGIRAMQKLTGRPYRTMTRREHAAWAAANSLRNSLSGGSGSSGGGGGGGGGDAGTGTNFVTPGPVDTCAVCTESLGICASSSSPSSSSSLSSLGSPPPPSSSSSSSSSHLADADDDSDPAADTESDIVLPLRCDHAIHTACMEQLLAHNNASVNDSCPQCASRFRADGVRVGAQPTGVMRVWCDGATRLPGFPNEPCLVMEADFSPGGGIQGARHPYPGARYTAHGFPRPFYMPESQRDLAFRMQLAFYWRNFFAVAASLSAPAAAAPAASSSSSSSSASAAESTVQAIVWAGVVSVKNELGTHGARCFSATDPTANAAYFRDVSSQLDRLGITAEFAAATRKHVALRVPLV